MNRRSFLKAAMTTTTSVAAFSMVGHAKPPMPDNPNVPDDGDIANGSLDTLKEIAQSLQNWDNPHAYSKTQVGLG